MLNTHARIAAGVLALSLAIPCSAQEKGPAWLRFQVSKVKPELRQEYEGYVKQAGAAYKKSGVRFYTVFENVAGDMTEYTSVLPIMKFADLDGPSPLSKALGEEASATLLRNIQRCLTSQIRYYAIPQDDLTINKGEAGSLWMMNRTFVNPGKMADYQAWMKNDYKPALEKAGVTQFRASRPIFGVASNEMQTIRMMKNLAELDGGPLLNQKLGAEAARAINAKATGLVRASTITIIRIRQDLSYIPAPATSSN